MNKLLKTLIPAAIVCLAATGCAKEASSTTGEDARTFLNVWLDKYHPGAQQEASGIYIFSDTPGTGDAWSADLGYNMADVTIRYLDGTVTSTTDKELAQQLGTYSVENYYGPIFLAQGSGISYAGVDALFSGMNAGGTRTALIPSWMLTTNRYATQQEYIDNCENSTHMIYTVTLAGQTDDPAAVENTRVAQYAASTFGADTTPSTYTEEEADGSFWFISDITGFKEGKEFPRDTTVTINYTGYRLDGQVFDTTIERVAKRAGIYSPSKTYEPVTINYAEGYDDITMSGSSSLISGFKGALSLMKWDLQSCITVFTSAHGYSYSGSGNAIPSYSPLVFELQIVKTEDE